MSSARSQDGLSEIPEKQFLQRKTTYNKLMDKPSFYSGLTLKKFIHVLKQNQSGIAQLKAVDFGRVQDILEANNEQAMQLSKEEGALEARLELIDEKEARLVQKLKAFEGLKDEEEEDMELNGQIKATIEKIEAVDKARQQLQEKIEKVRAQISERKDNHTRTVLFKNKGDQVTTGDKISFGAEAASKEELERHIAEMKKMLHFKQNQ